MKYFEIPVTKFTEDGTPETITSYFAIGDEAMVRKEVTEYFEDYPDLDFDFVELTEDEYAQAIVGNDGMVLFEESDSDDTGSKAEKARDIEDEMEDLQDLYYSLTDKLNSAPNLDLDKKEVIDANFKLKEAKEFFDQYDMLNCKKSLNEASEVISKILGESSAKEYVQKSFTLSRPNEQKLINYLTNARTDWKKLSLRLLAFLSDNEVETFMRMNGYEDLVDED